jgi:hypothetical protein
LSSAQKVLVGTTATLLAYPQVVTSGAVLEQPSAAGVRVRTPSTALPATGVTATIDTLSATTNTDAAAGDTTLHLAAAAAVIRGRQYLLGLTTGEVFVVVAKKGGTSTTVRLAEPLPCAALSGATLKGYAVSAALSSAQTAQIGEGLALWSVVFVAGMAVFESQFRIVRRIPRYTLTSSSLTTGWPILHTLRPSTDEDFTETLQAVWDNRLLPALAARGIRPEDVFSPDQLEPVHGTMIVHHLLAGDPARDGAFVDRAEETARQALETALSGKDFWVDAAAEEEAAPRDEDAPPAPYTTSRWTR